MRDDQLAVLADYPLPEGYTDLDRYRDFQKVFLGTDEGRRVLKIILEWGHVLRRHPRPAPIDPNLMLIAEGERDLALAIFSAITEEPRQKPQQQRVVERED